MTTTQAPADAAAARQRDAADRLIQLRERLARLERGEPCTRADVELARRRAIAQTEALATARDRLLRTYRSFAQRGQQCRTDAAGRYVEAAPAVQPGEEIDRLRTGLAALLAWAGSLDPDEVSRRQGWCEAVVRQCGAPDWRGWAHAVCAVGVRTLPGVHGAAITLGGADGAELVAATDAWTARMQELELIVGEGPSLTACDGSRVAIADLAAEHEEWQGYAAATSDHEVHAVTALPLRARQVCIGSLTLYGEPVGDPVRPVGGDATAFADIAAAALLADLHNAPAQGVADPAWFTFHVATGATAARLQISVDEAESRLRAHAFGRGKTLAEVAEQALDGRLDLG